MVSVQTDTFRQRTSSDGEEAFEHLIEKIDGLKSAAEECWLERSHEFSALEPAREASARNLIHYLALRRHDLRKLQNELASRGISSLGRSESHVMFNLNKILRLLHTMVQRTYSEGIGSDEVLSLDEGSAILAERAEKLLGRLPAHRRVRVMVTLPFEASTDYLLVRDLIDSGMDCARINAAHDSPEAWKKMAANIRKARKETGKSCMICVDIPGPKIRTGRFRSGPQVLKIRPDKDLFGRVTRPALVWLTDMNRPSMPPQPCAAQLMLSRHFISHLEVGSKIAFSDARRTRRSFKVTGIGPGGVWLKLRKTAYLVPETRLTLKGRNIKDETETLVGPLPPVELFAVLHIGDTLILTRSEIPGTPEVANPDGSVRPARISCTLPEIFDDVTVGEHVWFDDGKIGGVIKSVENDEIEIKINHAKPGGSKLKGDRGINLPETQLTLPSLTDTDRDVLAFAKDHAELIGYSFVRSAADVSELQLQLKSLGAEGMGLILKVETRNAFDNLPDLLLESLKSKNITGVMIARGDLAIEAGFERMAEVQEEILWMCEAAHLPVIWATQVLEQLSKKGVCSRAEITDAAMSERAECVMLNKGPYVVEAVRTLDDILTRMQSHLHKKNPLMRPLKLAERFFDNG